MVEHSLAIAWHWFSISPIDFLNIASKCTRWLWNCGFKQTMCMTYPPCIPLSNSRSLHGFYIRTATWTTYGPKRNTAANKLVEHNLSRNSYIFRARYRRVLLRECDFGAFAGAVNYKHIFPGQTFCFHQPCLCVSRNDSESRPRSLHSPINIDSSYG